MAPVAGDTRCGLLETDTDISGLPGCHRGKESACRCRRRGLDRYSCLENPHGQRGLVGYSLRGHGEADGTEHAQVCICARAYFYIEYFTVSTRALWSFQGVVSTVSFVLPGLLAYSHHHGEVCEPAEKGLCFRRTQPLRAQSELQVALLVAFVIGEQGKCPRERSREPASSPDRLGTDQKRRGVRK